MSVDKQLAELRSMASARATRWLPYGLLLAAVGLATAGAITGEAPWFVAALVIAGMGWLTHATMPYVEQAVEGLDRGRRVEGMVRVTEERWSDSSSWYATVDGASAGRWRIEFAPIGWTPREGDHRAVLIFIDRIEWPVLARLDDGLVYPRQRPRREQA